MGNFVNSQRWRFRDCRGNQVTLRQAKNAPWNWFQKEIEVDGFFAKARGGISVTAHYEGSKTTSFGRTESETTTRRVKFPVTVPARKVLQASLLGTKATIDIPYTATMVAYHQNKEVDRKQVTGVFKNTKTFSYSPQWGTPRPVRSSDCWFADWFQIICC